MEVTKTENTLKKELWELGLTDRQIASALNVDTDSISNWRTNSGLDRNLIEVKDNLNAKNSEDTIKKALWKLGFTDQQIANVFLTNKSNVIYWREKNGLKCNDKRKESRLKKQDEQLRLRLLEENYSDEEIAAAIGCSRGTITSWRWKHNISKGKRNSEKAVELSEKETIFLEYLKSKYPERLDSFLIALAKYIEPQVGISPTVKQREFVRKIKISGCKTVSYFDDGEYNNLNEAMDLFIKENPEIDMNIKKLKKLRIEMSNEHYEVFLKRKGSDKIGKQINPDKKTKKSNVLDPEPDKIIVNNTGLIDTQINLDKKICITVALDPESFEIIDKGRGQESIDMFINEIIRAYGNRQE